MRIIILIISILFSVVCFGQEKDSFGKIQVPISGSPPDRKVDSMDLKVISMKEFEAYLLRIDAAAQRQFNLTESKKYEEILKIIKSVYAEADKKRRK